MEFICKKFQATIKSKKPSAGSLCPDPWFAKEILLNKLKTLFN